MLTEIVSVKDRNHVPPFAVASVIEELHRQHCTEPPPAGSGNFLRCLEHQYDNPDGTVHVVLRYVYEIERKPALTFRDLLQRARERRRKAA